MPSTVKKCAVLLTFDFDAESLWEDSGLNTPTYQSRGRYGARVGVPRILSLLEEYNIQATFFVPGVTAERYPDILREISAQGHEIGHHGYRHRSPTALSTDEERLALEKGLEALEGTTGVRPLGYRSPSWDLSHHSINLLQEYDFLYDSSLMGDDFQLYSLGQGQDSAGLVEIPVSWELDDAPHFMFNFSPKYRAGLSAPSKVLEIWMAEFDGAYLNEGAFTLTMHPQIIGRYHRMRMLEQLIEYMAGHRDAWFMTCTQAAKDWQYRHSL
jgi:peptidoglycan/xylan/chitin deacetylase (PgdA/CDA1 family)